MHYNSANMSFGQLCTQIQPIAFPEFPLHMQKYICVWLVYSSVIYNIPLGKSVFFSDRWKIAREKDRTSAKMGLKVD